MKLTSLIASERSKAEAEALDVSKSELEKTIHALELQKHTAREAAEAREKDIRSTVAGASRRVRCDLATEVYTALLPVIRAHLADASRATAREVTRVWQTFTARCLEQTGHALGARPVVNIMIAELAPGAEPFVYQSGFDGFINSLGNLEGVLEAALLDGVSPREVETAMDAIEAGILRFARNPITSSVSPRMLERWDLMRTALSGGDARRLHDEKHPQAPPKPFPAHMRVTDDDLPAGRLFIGIGSR